MRKFSDLGMVMVLAILLTMAVGRPSAAFPKFAKKENKPCAYCHVKPAGGGKRNAAGEWYQKHGLSFVGYTPAKAAAEAAGTTKTLGATKPKVAPKKPAVKKPAAKASTKP